MAAHGHPSALRVEAMNAKPKIVSLAVGSKMLVVRNS